MKRLAYKSLKRVAGELSLDTFTAKKFDALARTHSATVVRHFRSWAAALKKAGLKPGKGATRYTDDDYFENLLRCGHTTEDNRSTVKWICLLRSFLREHTSANGGNGRTLFVPSWDKWKATLTRVTLPVKAMRLALRM